jgi:hypothetical protein
MWFPSISSEITLDMPHIFRSYSVPYIPDIFASIAQTEEHLASACREERDRDV